MSMRASAVAGLAIGLLLLATAWVLELELARVILVAPLVVLCVGAAAGVAVVFARAAYESYRNTRRPWLVWAVAAAFVALVVVLTALGVELPRRSH